MNFITPFIASLLRHCFVTLATLGAFLASKNLIGSGDIAAVNAAGLQLGDVLTVVILATGGRIALAAAGKVFPTAAGKLGGGAPGLLPLLFLTCAAAALLAACSPAQLTAAQTLPLQGCIHHGGSRLCYSSRDGLSVQIDPAK